MEVVCNQTLIRISKWGKGAILYRVNGISKIKKYQNKAMDNKIPFDKPKTKYKPNII